MEMPMDREYEKAARLTNLKVQCEQYIRKIVDAYCDHNGDSYDFEHVTNNSILRRQLLVCPILEQSLKNRNISIPNFMKHMTRPALHKMVQHWLTTLPAYDQDVDYPAGEIMNVLVWSELSGTYGYLINLSESYVWQIEADMVMPITKYFKLANRFFECKQNSQHGEICRAWLRFKPVDIDHLPEKFDKIHLESVEIPAMVRNAKSRGEVLLNMAEHLIAKSLDPECYIIPDVEYTSERDKQLNIMMRPEIHHI
jgi:hypothetical protein